MTALFSALSIGLGIFARSTKEGQYYLLPLFLGVMPLVMLSMMPNADLTWGMSLVPVTGFCLLVQKLIGPAPMQEIWPFVAPVLGALLVCALLACWWAVRQFHREDVLFREAEGGGGFLRGFGPSPP
jgi:sodium transport system permease protein